MRYRQIAREPGTTASIPRRLEDAVRVLSDADAGPCILWGENAMRFYEIPSTVLASRDSFSAAMRVLNHALQRDDVIISDDRIDLAGEVLIKAGYKRRPFRPTSRGTDVGGFDKLKHTSEMFIYPEDFLASVYLLLIPTSFVGLKLSPTVGLHGPSYTPIIHNLYLPSLPTLAESFINVILDLARSRAARSNSDDELLYSLVLCWCAYTRELGDAPLGEDCFDEARVEVREYWRGVTDWEALRRELAAPPVYSLPPGRDGNK